MSESTSKAKLLLSIVSLTLAVPAFAFALFGWTDTSQFALGNYCRDVCIFGSLGAMILGGLLFNESLPRNHIPVKPTKTSALDFFALMKYEAERKKSNLHSVKS